MPHSPKNRCRYPSEKSLNSRQIPLLLCLLGVGLGGCSFSDDDDDGPRTTSITFVNAVWDDLDLCITPTSEGANPDSPFPRNPRLDLPVLQEQQFSIPGESSFRLDVGFGDVGIYDYVAQTTASECGVSQSLSGRFTISLNGRNELVLCGDPELWNLAWDNRTNSVIDSLVINGEPCPTIVEPQSTAVIGTFDVGEPTTLSFRCNGRVFLLSQVDPPCPEGEICPPMIPSQRLAVITDVGEGEDCITTFEWEQPDACADQ